MFSLRDRLHTLLRGDKMPIIHFDLALPLRTGVKLKCIKDNYYELPDYGDWIDYGRDNNNIMRVLYYESENCYHYQFGRFEGDKFVPVLGYTTGRNDLEDIPREVSK